jgi:hypothetical protein
MILTKAFGLWVPRGWLQVAVAAMVVALVALLLPAGPSGLVVSGAVGVAAMGMIMDDLLEFADATSVAAAAGTALIGDVIPLTVARDLGNGEPVYLVITTDTEIITGGSAGTVKFQLVSDAQAAIATDGSATVHIDTGTFVTDDAAANDAQLNAGGLIACIALPLEGKVYEAFLGILCITATTTTTAGKINAFLTKDPSKWKAAPDAL